MNKAIVVAKSTNNIIGLDNDLPWNIPEDLRHFKELTTKKNSAVIMGRKTYESIGKKLPNRKNIVVTSKNIKDVTCCKSISESIQLCEELLIENVFFIGGKSIYEEAVSLCNEMYITVINITIKELEKNNIVRMFNFNNSEWKTVSIKKIRSIKNDTQVTFRHLTRIDNEL